MTEREALTALATPPPEPFRQVMWKLDDFVRWDEWNAKRIEALNVAAADEPGETPRLCAACACGWHKKEGELCDCSCHHPRGGVSPSGKERP